MVLVLWLLDIKQILFKQNKSIVSSKDSPVFSLLVFISVALVSVVETPAITNNKHSANELRR